MAWIQSYSCMSAAGDSAAEFFASLRSGRQNVTEGAFRFLDTPPDTVQELLLEKMIRCFRQLGPALERSGRYGVIFASTKGMNADFVGHELPEYDPLTPLLDLFLKRSELMPERHLCLSNACSSSLAAIALAERWLGQGLEQVLVIAADAVTPFVEKGFQALRLISQDGPKPFAADRSGFFLGEAAACLLLGRSGGEFKIHKIGLDSEGSAVTRPSHSGESLKRAAAEIGSPDVLIAHGTGTVINDQTEDLAFSESFSSWITGTKWCVGHTLATSGALDIIAALEALRHQYVFGLATTKTIDPSLKGRYLLRGMDLKFSRVMVSSLGFGGMHASCLVEKTEPDVLQTLTPCEEEIGCDWFHHSFTQNTEPEWAGLVDRWYQLDAPAFALPETFWRHRTELNTRPDLLFLASPQASNLTDDAFERAPTPAKFVHTLPNIRGAALLKVMDWAGEVYCVQNDPGTVATAISEAIQAIRFGVKEAWVASVTRSDGKFTGHLFRLRPRAGKISLNQNMANRPSRDKDLFHWLEASEGRN